MLLIYPYNESSKGMKLLAADLKSKCIRLEESKFEPGPGMTVINWGNINYGALDGFEKAGCKVINKSVDKVVGRKDFYDLMYDRVNIPEYTTNYKTAQAWINQGKLLVGRSLQSDYIKSITKLWMSDDLETLSEFKKSNLFTIYIPKSSEFRVHIFKGNVVYIQQKLLRPKDDDGNEVSKSAVNWKIRNHENGFILGTPVIKPPKQVYDGAYKAFYQSELDFCAYDVIYSKSLNKAFVLEANPRPNLEDTQLKNEYVKQLKEIINDEV